MAMNNFEVELVGGEKKQVEADNFTTLADIVTLYRGGFPVAAFVNWTSIIQVETPQAETPAP